MRSGLLSSLVCTLMLASCGGGDGNDPQSPAPPPPPPPPQSIASFAAASTCTALTPLAFDASASTSSDGSALNYRWNFGDGALGNGAKIAHAFGSAGSFTVTLTVTDGTNHTATASKSITVVATTSPGPAISVLGVIRGIDALAIEGVTATAPDGTTATSNALGRLSIPLGTDVPLLVRLAKTGYADQFVTVAMPHTAGADAEFDAVMRPRSAAQSFDATAGGSLTTADGASLTLPANGVVDGTGAAVSGAIDVAMTPVDVTLPGGGGFPGTYDGVNADASMTPIVSFGTTEFVLSRNGQRLQVAPGKTATIELPLSAIHKADGTPVVVGDSIPLWSLDEKTGVWINEGSGTVVAAAKSASSLAMRAQVAHFSWWNVDIGFEPYGPRPDCRADTSIGLPEGAPAFATATFCNFLAEFEREDETAGKLGMSKAMAAAVPILRPGYSRRATVAIPGPSPGPVPVPANANIVLSATALNGTWTGRKVVNGPVGQVDVVTVLMRPIGTSGDEGITLPFDSPRSLNADQTARFTFSGGPPKYAVIKVERANSTLTGTVKLLRGSSVLASADFGDLAANLALALPDTGAYTIEVVNTARAVGAYRLTASLAGSAVDESLGTPFDVTRPLPQYGTQRIGFDVDGTTGFLVNLRRTGGAAVTLHLRDAAGALLATMTSESDSAPATTLRLSAAGHYVIDVTPKGGAVAEFRVSGETTQWVAAAATLPADVNSQLVDMQLDRNGAPVVAYELPVVVQGTIQRTLRLRRLVGTEWNDVASDLGPIARPCAQLGESLAFDASNRPVIAYAERDTVTGDAASVTVLRYDGSSWTAIGPSGGKLPGTDTFGANCRYRPVARVAPDGAVTVAHLVDNNVAIHTFDGTSWVGFAGAGGDLLPTFGGQMDLGFDPSGRAVLVYRSAGGIGLSVRRVSTASPAAWQPLGTGELPLTPALVDIHTPRLRFDAAGQPIIATYAAVPTSASTFTGGLAVFRFNGSDWQTTGGYRVTDDGRVDVNDLHGPGFTVTGNETLLGFLAATGGVARPLVQRNTAGGFAPLGQNLGEIPQLYSHGLNAAVVPNTYLLESVGGETYLAVLAQPVQTGIQPKTVTLLKLVH